MSIITARGLTKSFGLKQVFSDLSFGIDDRDRIGIIGVNGCGKSTLLKILSRQMASDGGSIEMRQDLRVEFLSQNPPFDDEHTVLEHIFYAASETSQVVRDYEQVVHKLAEEPGSKNSDRLLKRLDELSQRMDSLGAWEYETKAQTILSKLGVVDFDARMGSLSGGYRKRIALARALLDESDLLILDEPTNHLDAGTVAWLEGYLQSYNGAVMLVTHDRYFLDRVTKRIFEIDHGEIRAYEGNFEYYLEKKAELNAMAASMEAKRKNILRKELEWLRRGAKARRTKQKAKIQRAETLQEISYVRPTEELRFGISARRLGTKVVDIKHISKVFDEKKIVSDFSYTVERGQRLGIIGPNGSGKSTLANMITGRLQPDGGEVSVGETVYFGYYDQESQGLDPEESAIAYVKREGGELIRGLDGKVLTATAALEQFLFTSAMMFSPIGNLSGGEKRRLYLVRILMSDPNFLILDEPTNDLDIATLQALEDFLDSFGGSLLVISHDRYFLDRTVDQLICLDGEGGIRMIPGNYSTYEQICEQELILAQMEKEAAREQAAAKKKAGGGSKSQPKQVEGQPRKLKYSEKIELAKLEDDMPSLEEELKDVEAQMIEAATDYVKLNDLSTRHAELKQKIDEAMARWEELAEFAE